MGVNAGKKCARAFWCDARGKQRIGSVSQQNMLKSQPKEFYKWQNRKICFLLRAITHIVFIIISKRIHEVLKAY